MWSPSITDATYRYLGSLYTFHLYHDLWFVQEKHHRTLDPCPPTPKIGKETQTQSSCPLWPNKHPKIPEIPLKSRKLIKSCPYHYIIIKLEPHHSFFFPVLTFPSRRANISCLTSRVTFWQAFASPESCPRWHLNLCIPTLMTLYVSLRRPSLHEPTWDHNLALFLATIANYDMQIKSYEMNIRFYILIRGQQIWIFYLNVYILVRKHWSTVLHTTLLSYCI